MQDSARIHLPALREPGARALELALRPQDVGVLNRNASRWIVLSSYYSFEAHLTGTVIAQQSAEDQLR
jgi:hypothetical protein